MRAHSVRQPYAELLLREIKTVELRSRRTTIIGERFYLYAAEAKTKRPVWSEDLRVQRARTGARAGLSTWPHAGETV